MMAALPDKAPATPAKPRKVLVLGKAGGFVHSSIPLAAKTVEALGNKTKAWSTTITYDAKDINTENLKQYDMVFLDSTTGAFLDMAPIIAPGQTTPTPEAQAEAKKETDARRQALLDFVRGGKGLGGIHAATDSYHANPARGGGGGAPAAPGGPGAAPGAAGGGRGGGRGAGAPGAPGAPSDPAVAPAAPQPTPPTVAETLAQVMMQDGDTNHDSKLSKSEFTALADNWFAKVDVDKHGKVRQQEFTQAFAAILPPAPSGGAGFGGPGGGRGAGNAAPVARGQGPQQVGTWPEFNAMIGGFFKFHWVDPQLIHVKIDDPKSPLTAMFKGQGFDIHDETYTFAQDSFSRKNVHVLTSIDYDKMTPEDKAKEPAGDARMDGDYALSYIHREGQGRVFYEAHGHSERNYAIKPLLEHILAGIQYALGDLKADDSPSVK
jgi:type 1 glutamine amidotransferase